MRRIVLMMSLLFISLHTTLYAPPAPSLQGALDTSFNDFGYVLTTIGDSAQIYGTTVQPDGKIVAVGTQTVSGVTTAIVARYTIDGELDTTFASPNGYTGISLGGMDTSIAYCLAVQVDGKIVVAGSATGFSEDFYFVARFLPDGLIDAVGNGGSGFGPAMEGTGPGYVLGQLPGGMQNAYGIAMQPADQKIVVTGSSGSSLFIARYTTAGLLDTLTDLGNTPFVVGVGYVLLNPLSTTCIGRDVVIDASGNIVVVGQVTNGQGYILIARYVTNGSIDTSFGAGGSGWNSQNPGPNSGGNFIGYSLALQSTGKIIVAAADDVNAIIARFNADGTFDSSFGISGQSCFFTTFGVDSAGAYGVAVEQDDSIVFGGTCNDSGLGLMAAIGKIVANGSAFDTTFGLSSGYTTLQITSGFDCAAQAFVMQPNGRFVLGGFSYLGEMGNQFLLSRYLGTSPQGCIDVNYQAFSSPGYCMYPTTSNPSEQPKVTAIYPKSDGSLFVLTSDPGFDGFLSQLGILDVNGTAGTPAPIIGYFPANDVIVDSTEKAVVVGTDGVNGWIARYEVVTDSVQLEETFAGGFVTSSQSSSLVRLGQQTNSLYVAIGQSSTSANGILIAYTEDGALADHTTSVPFGYDFSGGVSGYNTMGFAVFTDMVIAPDNSIYIAYQNNGGIDPDDRNICIAKFLADGSGLDTTFYASGIADTGLEVSTCGVPCITFDADFSHIIIAATEISTGNIFVSRWATDGHTSHTGGVLYQSTSLFSTPILTKMQCDTHNNLVLNGYDNYNFFVAKCSSDVITTVDLDTTFAPYEICPGILRTNYNDNNPTNTTDLIPPYRVSNTVCINDNGAILFGGYEYMMDSSIISVVGQVVGNTGGTVYTQVPRYPGQIFPGTINTNFGTGGTLEVPGSLTIHPEAMNVLTSGSLSGNILIGVTNSSSSEIAGLNSDFTLNTTSFGIDLEGSTSGITPTLPTDLVNISNIMTDTFGNMYVVGDNDTSTVLTKLSSNGTMILWSYQNDDLAQGYCIAQQASGRILIGGYDSNVTKGVIVALNPNTGQVDTSFNQGSNNPGYYYTGLYTSVTSLSIINDTDRILFSHANYLNSKVQVVRLLENGALDTSFPTGNPTLMVNNVNWSKIRMQQDVDGKIVVATIVGNGSASIGFELSRYLANGSDDVVNVSISVAGYIGYSVSLSNILCLSDGTTLVLGFNGAGGNMVLAKLTADFALDTNFATGGILQTPVRTFNSTTMSNFYALGMSSVAPYDIIVSGDDGENPYLVGIVSGLASAVTAVPQSTTSWGLPGTLDTTYNPNSGEEAGFVDLSNEITTNLGAGAVKAMILNNANGSYFVLADDGIPAGEGGTNSYLTKFTSADVQDTAFGTNGVITIAGMKQANNMIFAQDGNLLVVGQGSYPNGMLVSINLSNGGVNFALTTSSFFYNFAVAQQTNGRIIVAGANGDGKPALIAYSCVDGAVDRTFADNGIYSFTDFGYFITTIALDAYDNIYFMVDDNSTHVAYVKKLSYDGTTILWTADSTLSSVNGVFDRIVIDQQGNVVVATESSVGTILMNRYSYIDGTTLQGPLTITLYDVSMYRPGINALLVDTTSPTGNLVILGADTGSSPSNIPFVLRVLPDLSGLDTTFNAAGAHPGVQPIAVTNPTSGIGVWYAGFIGANGKITAGGYALINGDTEKPYLMRLYGNDFIDQFAPESLTAGTQGTIDTNFAGTGFLDLGNVSSSLDGLTPQVVLPLPNGYQYVACTDGTLIRMTNGNILDTSFGTGGFATTPAPTGVSAMIIDSNGCLVLTGTSGSYGWVARYTNDDSGLYDPTFNNGFAVDIGANTQAISIIEQTLARLIIAGRDLNSGNATLWAFTNTGAVDTTFNANVTPGYYGDSSSHVAAAVIADEYDRLIYAHYVIPRSHLRTYLNNVVLTRLTASGELDLSFGDGASYPYSGSLTDAIMDADDATQIRLGFDVNNNIVVAAHTLSGIAIAAYQNGTGATAVELQLTLSGLFNPSALTNLIATADNKILVSGNQISSDANASLMWIARIKDNGSGAYQLDTTFAPAPAAIPGILQFKGIDNSDVLSRNCTSIAIYGTGEISIVGVIDNDGTMVPFMMRAYDVPYTSQQTICQFAQPIGTDDATFGVTTSVDNGILFCATGALGGRALNQSSQAIALQDDQTIVVACDGQTTYGGQSNIMINMFDVDGLLNQNFNPSAASPCIPGQVIVLDSFDNQYVQDMLTFSVNDINKAILVGYATNTALDTSNSLVIQYDLTPDAPVLDNSFGGFNGDPLGVAMGNGASQGYTVGRQSMGRIIVGGITDSPYQGLLQAYTSAGLLDQSFGADGYFSSSDTHGIYAAAIDSNDRVVIAYNDGDDNLVVARLLADGSGLDTSFNPTGDIPGTFLISYGSIYMASNNSYRIALDQQGNIFAASVLTDSGIQSIGLTVLDEDGNPTFSNYFDGSDFGGLTNFTMTQLLITQHVAFDSDYVVLVGYDQTSTGPEVDEMMIASFINNAGTWGLNDNFFNQADTPGYIKYVVGMPGVQRTARAIIHPDGRIIIAGSGNYISS